MKLAWRTNQQFWRSHNAVLYGWCCFSIFLSVNHYPREFNILQKKNKKQKKPNDLGPARQNIAGNQYRIPRQKKIAFSYSDLGDTFEIKLNDLKPIKQSQEELCVSKGS